MRFLIYIVLSALLIGVLTASTHIQTPHRAQAYLARYDQKSYDAPHKYFSSEVRVHHHRSRLRAGIPSWSGPDTASWFDDTGSTASGKHFTYGVANLEYPLLSTVTFKHNGNIVTAVIEDRGPYVAGRQWDLNAPLKDALGCPDICTVYYHLGG